MEHIKEINNLIAEAKNILIIQADNPDADSLGSALALEQILMELKKDTYLYCGVDMPSYLRYLSGWDRVFREVPSHFDLSIIVDASTTTLLEKLHKSKQIGKVSSKPCLVLDHHEIVEDSISFATITINKPDASSTGELIYLIAKKLGWTLNNSCLINIMSSILGDTQGLANQLTSAETYRIMAEMVDEGINRPALEELRREYSKMEKDIFRYKAKLIERTEFFNDGRTALVIVPQEEINEYSALYNPAPLIQTDMLQTKDIELAIVIKKYDDGKITGAIRSNPSKPIAAILASHFGGGGHKFASGFKVYNKDINDLKNEFIENAEQLLAKDYEDI